MIYERTPALKIITEEQFKEYKSIEEKVISQVLRKTKLDVDIYSYLIGFKTVKKDEHIIAERKANLSHTEIMENILGGDYEPKYYIVDNRLASESFKLSDYKKSISNHDIDFFEILALNLIDFCYAAKIQTEINSYGVDDYFQTYRRLPKREEIVKFLNKAAIKEFDIEPEIIEGIDAIELLDDDTVNRTFFDHKVSWFYNKYNDKALVKQITAIVKKAKASQKISGVL